MNTAKTDLIETKDRWGNTVWRIKVNGQEYPLDFVQKSMALSHMGLLRSQGFKEGQRAA